MKDFLKSGQEIQNHLNKRVEESEVVHNYDEEADMHYISLYGTRLNIASKTKKTWALVDLDYDGNIIGFEIFGTKTNKTGW
jgi:uncharacterized protein YuzE